MTGDRTRIIFDTSVVLSFAGRPGQMFSSWQAVLNNSLHAFTSACNR